MPNRYGIGVDLGGTKILAAIVELETGQVVASAKKKTVASKDSKEKEHNSFVFKQMDNCVPIPCFLVLLKFYFWES